MLKPRPRCYNSFTSACLLIHAFGNAAEARFAVAVFISSAQLGQNFQRNREVTITASARASEHPAGQIRPRNRQIR
jgi:hypothetical protein